MQMDRSFFALKHFLLRIINGPDGPQPARTTAARPRRSDRPRQEADVGEDWIRLEL